MNAKFYPRQDSGRFDVARLLLALFSRESVEDIIDLVQYRGDALIDDIYNPSNMTEADPNRPLAIFSPKYLNPIDAPAVILGFSTVLLSTVRTPASTETAYNKILQQAYGLPAEYANKLALGIETVDPIVVDNNNDGTNDWTEYLNAAAARIENAIRTPVNNAANLLGLGGYFFWDSNQSYDKDLLFEYAQLGQVVSDMQRRGRLMTTQAMLARNNTIFLSGDAEGDVEYQLGDAMRGMLGRKLPSDAYNEVAGNVARKGMSASHLKLHRMLGDAGLTEESNGVPTSERGEKIRTAMMNFLGGKPSQSLLAGLIPGAGLFRAAKSLLSGDPDVAAEVGELYGDVIAEQWANGDIEGIVTDALYNSLVEGDPNSLDYFGNVPLEMVGDTTIDLGEVEIGGLLSRWRDRAQRERVKRRIKRIDGRYKVRAHRADMKNKLDSYKDDSDEAFSEENPRDEQISPYSLGNEDNYNPLSSENYSSEEGDVDILNTGDPIDMG